MVKKRTVLRVAPAWRKKELRSLRELSQEFGLRLSSLRVYASSRRFGVYKIGSRVLVDRNEFNEWRNRDRRRPYKADLEPKVPNIETAEERFKRHLEDFSSIQGHGPGSVSFRAEIRTELLEAFSAYLDSIERSS